LSSREVLEEVGSRQLEASSVHPFRAREGGIGASVAAEFELAERREDAWTRWFGFEE
jgi:hypothetical protein